MKTLLAVAVVAAGLLVGQIVSHVHAQTVPPAPLYYLEFVQPTTGRVILYGPNPSLAACLADMQAIRGAVAGLGSVAWSWQPAVICYHVPQMLELITAVLLAFVSVHGIHVTVGFGKARHAPPILCAAIPPARLHCVPDHLGGHGQER